MKPAMNAAEKLSLNLKLPAADGRLEQFRLSAPRNFPRKAAGAFNRVAYSAAHVVADPLAAIDPWQGCAIDWDATIAYRRNLWGLGLAWPKPWIPHSAVWVSIGTPRWN